MIERDNVEITIKRQADLLSINRTSVYRPEKERTENEANVKMMHRIDEIYTKQPYFGYRRMTWFLQEQGFEINRKRVRRLMRRMGLEAIYPKPNLSKRLHATYTRPYLLRGLPIDRPNQVWGIDITYELLEKAGVKVSMEGKGRATDNSRTERYFRSLKYECIYLNEFEDPRALRKGIAHYVQFYNTERPHASLRGAKPDQFYAHSTDKIAS
ncbi:IS3 family transposase [Paenibacillus hodogayensis]|uniref:IS3 family transposase n=1 Tax=Paenibacillus hodogayensis TaxID=279208 RepID=UPI0031E6B11F